MAISAGLTQLTNHFTRRSPPATDAEIAAFVEAVGFQPPADYLEVIRQTNGAYGEGSSLVFLYSLADALERTRETEGLPPRVIVIGSDGGDVQYLLDGRAKTPQFVSLSLHDEVAESTRLGPSLEKALGKLQKDRQKQEALFLKRSKLPPLATLSLGQRGEVARLACGKGDEFAIHSIAFSSDGSVLALAGSFGIQIWSVTGWQRIAELPLPEGVESMASCLRLDAKAGEVLSVHNQHLLLQDFRGRRVVQRQSIALSTNQQMTADGRFVVRVIADQRLSVLDTQDGVERQLAPADGRPVGRLHGLGNRVLSTRFDAATGQHRLDVWNPGERRTEFSEVLPAALNTVALLDEDRFLRLVYGGIEPQVINVRTGVSERVGLPELPGGGGASSVMVAIGGTRRMAMGTSQAVCLAELGGSAPIEVLECGAGRGPTMLAASPDGQWLVTAGMQSMMLSQFAVRVWKIG